MPSDRSVPALFLAALAVFAAPRPGPAKEHLVFVSAFAPGAQGGIHAYAFDTEAGKLTPASRTAGAENPFFLALSPGGKYLYSIHARQFGGKEKEQVAAYQVVGRSGELKLLSEPFALLLWRRVIVVVVQSNLTVGHHFLVLRKTTQFVVPSVADMSYFVWMHAD